MKKISYRHKKIAAEKDSKDLNKIYFKSVRKDAENNLPKLPPGEKEERRSYFQRLNNHIESNKEIYDNLPGSRRPPFGRDAIIFVGSIPESELETLNKENRLNFVKWIASNYLEFKEIFTLENVSKIRSLIDSSQNYSFLNIDMYSPAHYIHELSQKTYEAVERSERSDPIEKAIASKFELDSLLFSSASEIVNNSNVASILSDREKAFLKLGAVLTDKVNNLTLILDFMSSENSDIEIKKASDLEALYNFDLEDKESIIASFNSLDQNQDEWHDALAAKQEGASNGGGKYGYGYETNIVVHQFDDGWKVVYLPSNEDSFMVPWEKDPSFSHDRIQEGDNNGLCLGSGAKRYNDSKSGYVYSLRSPTNKPMATLRVDADFANTKDFSNKNVNFHEIKEKSNKNPGVETSIYLNDFFKSINLDPSVYKRHLFDVKLESLDKLSSEFADNKSSNFKNSQKFASELFEWIGFLNKKRSSKKEAQKYREYLSYYDNLVSARNILFNSDDGLFLNEASFENDESRVRKYIKRVLRRVVELSSGSFLDHSFVKKLIGLDYSWIKLPKLYERVLSGIPEYKEALSILAEEFPELLFKATLMTARGLGTALKSGGDRKSAEDIALISGSKLLDGDQHYLKAYFDAVTEYENIFDSTIFSEKYKQKNVIEFLDNYLDKNQNNIMRIKAYRYYYGDNLDTIKAAADHISGEVSKSIDFGKTNVQSLSEWKNTLYSFDLKKIKDIARFSENIDSDIISEAVEVADEHLYNILQKSKKGYIGIKLLEKYYMLRAVAKNKFLIDIDRLKLSEDKVLNSILEYILNIKIHKDVDASSKELAENLKNLTLFDSSSELLIKIKEKIKEKISSPNSIVQIIILKKAIDIVALNGTSSFDDILEKINSMLSEESLLTYFKTSPEDYFSTNLDKDAEYSNLIEYIIPTYVEKLFDANKFTSEYDYRVKAEQLSNLLDKSKGNSGNISLIIKAVDSNIESILSEISQFQSMTPGRSYADVFSKLRNSIGLLNVFDNKKSLAKQKEFFSNKLFGSKEYIKNAIKENPSIYYEYKLQDIKWLDIDRKKAALYYIHKVLSQKSGGGGEFADMIIADLGLPKQASVLSEFFIKNNYFNEAYSLAKIFAG